MKNWNRGNYIITAILLAAGILAVIPRITSANEVRTVRVAFPTQTGMSEVGEGGDLNGYNYDYLQYIAEYAGWKIKYITFDGQTADESISSAMEMILSGEADLLGPMLQSEEAEELFEFSNKNYGVVYTELCASDRSNITSANYMDCAPLRVAVYEKATKRNQEIEDYLKQHEIEYELVNCESTKEQVNALSEGRADVLSSITLSYFEGTHMVAECAPRPYYFVSTKGNQELIAELDAAIIALNQSQPHIQEQLEETYFGDTSDGFSLSDTEQEYLENLGTLQVLCLPNYAPYVSAKEDGTPEGVLISLLDDFAADNQLKVKYTFSDSVVSMEDEWASGQYDCMLGLPLSADYCAEHQIIQSEALLSVGMGIISNPKTDKKPEESTIAVYSQQKKALNQENYQEVVELYHPDDCILAVANGDVDYAYADRLSLEYMNIEENWSLACTPVLNQNQNTGVFVSRSMDTRFLTILNKYIHTLSDSTVTNYLSESTRHSYTGGFFNYVQDNPMESALLISVIAILIVSSALFALTSRRNRKRNIQLQKANAAKSEFLSRMSHDIRTPLNAILGFAELGRQDVDNKEKLQGDLDRIHSSGEFLLGLVNDVLDMTKIESNAMELKLQPYTKTEFKKEMETLLLPLCKAKQIEFSAELSELVPDCIRVDKLRFNQIFFNLLSNAVKFTPEKGKILLRCDVMERDRREAMLNFIVQDNGIGMSEEFQKKMFDSFSQEQQHISGQEGTGLGLSIVKSIVELMDGRIQVDSHLGSGSTFSIQLPVQICELPTQVSSEKGAVQFDILQGKSVLLCEDHPVNTQLACRLLEKAGMHVTSAGNGQVGVEYFKGTGAGTFDAILMDIRMPVMDGITATRTIRGLDHPDAKNIPIIAMTANAFEEDIENCRTAGMNAHLAKPFEVQKLYQTLAEQIDAAINRKKEA